MNKLRGVFNVLAVKAPGFGDRKKEMLQESPSSQERNSFPRSSARNWRMSSLTTSASASRRSDKDATTVVGGKGEKKDIDNSHLADQGAD